MSNVIDLGDKIANWDKTSTLNIHEMKKREHARRAWFFQRRKLALDNVARSIGGDSPSPQPKGEPSDAS
jgi:hypothetical protein